MMYPVNSLINTTLTKLSSLCFSHQVAFEYLIVSTGRSMCSGTDVKLYSVHGTDVKL